MTGVRDSVSLQVSQHHLIIRTLIRSDLIGIIDRLILVRDDLLPSRQWPKFNVNFQKIVLNYKMLLFGYTYIDNLEDVRIIDPLEGRSRLPLQLEDGRSKYRIFWFSFIKMSCHFFFKQKMTSFLAVSSRDLPIVANPRVTVMVTDIFLKWGTSIRCRISCRANRPTRIWCQKLACVS